MPVINPATNKVTLKFAGTPTSLDNLGTAWMADFAAFLVTNPNFSLFDISISNTSPVDTTRLWLDPAGTTTSDSEAGQGQLKIYNGSSWVNCTPSLFATWIVSKVTPLPEYTESALAPTPNLIGHIWKNTSLSTVSGVLPNTKAIWSGSSWVQLSDIEVVGATPSYGATEFFKIQL